MVTSALARSVATGVSVNARSPLATVGRAIGAAVFSAWLGMFGPATPAAVAQAAGQSGAAVAGTPLPEHTMTVSISPTPQNPNPGLNFLSGGVVRDRLVFDMTTATGTGALGATFGSTGHYVFDNAAAQSLELYSKKGGTLLGSIVVAQDGSGVLMLSGEARTVVARGILTQPGTVAFSLVGGPLKGQDIATSSPGGTHLIPAFASDAGAALAGSGMSATVFHGLVRAHGRSDNFPVAPQINPGWGGPYQPGLPGSAPGGYPVGGPQGRPCVETVYEDGGGSVWGTIWGTVSGGGSVSGGRSRQRTQECVADADKAEVKAREKAEKAQRKADEKRDRQEREAAARAQREAAQKTRPPG
ncbi:MAG: hypothetical protein ACKVPX_08400 [Myxococcaceae bacterium]